MKNILRGLTFWIIAIGFILLVAMIAETLAKLATMDMIMTIVYTALGYGFVYILKN